MKYAAKIQSATVKAWQLGANSPMESQLTAQGKIRRTGQGYALFSREAVHGQGQEARAGDYFKVDGAGCPYPNDRAWFLENHEHLGGDEYRQKPKALEIWEKNDPMPESVAWLVEQGKLRLAPEDPSAYFNAHLWGADLSAGEDAVLVLYGTDRDAAGRIQDVQFNFVVREEFRRTYRYCNAQGAPLVS